MKKRLGVLALILILVVTMFAGCSSEEGINPENPYAVNVDDAHFAEYLVSNIEFVDDMTLVDIDIALDFYGIDEADIRAACVYMSTGATAEELAVINVANDEAAGMVAEIYEKRIENQISVFEDYVPAELTKLEQALIIQVDNAMVYVACDDPAAAEDAMVAYIEEFLAEK